MQGDPDAHRRLPERPREPVGRAISPPTPTTTGPTARSATRTSTPATPTTTTSSGSAGTGSTTPTSGSRAWCTRCAAPTFRPTSTTSRLLPQRVLRRRRRDGLRRGLPPDFTLGGQTWDFLSGALDIVAHELTHGVTEYTSNLIYRNESGALNEAFSDIMGTSVEFFFQPAGSGPLQRRLPDRRGRRSGPGGLRSMANPGAFGDPDHYSKRFLGTDDNGGVHINSGIANHAFYLAIEGGTNRTSGLSVQGVGGGQPRADREGVLPRVHAAAAGERDVRRGARRDDPGRARSLRRQQRRRTRGDAGLDRRGGELMRSRASSRSSRLLRATARRLHWRASAQSRAAVGEPSAVRRQRQRRRPAGASSLSGSLQFRQELRRPRRST